MAVDGPLAVQRLAQRPDHAAQEGVPDRHGQDLAGPLDLLALLDLVELAEDDHADLADVQVERQAPDAVLEHEQLAGHGRRQALDPRDAIAALDDGAYLFPRGAFRLVLLDEARQRVPDLLRPDRQLSHCPACLVGFLRWHVCVALPGRQPAPNGGQTARRGPVYKFIPDLDGKSTHDRGIYDYIQVNVVPVGAGQRLREPPALARRQLDRGTHHRDQLLPAPRRDVGAQVQGRRSGTARAGAPPSG